jgi:hypothetical protein
VSHLYLRMKLLFRSRNFSELLVGLAYMIIGVIGWVCARFLPHVDRFIPPCMFRMITGLPCPACGATHSGMYLSHFQISKAFSANPFFFLLYLALAVWGLNSFVGLVWGYNIGFALTEKEKQYMFRGLLSLMVANWLFMIGRVLFHA